MEMQDIEADMANKLGIPKHHVCTVGSTLICGVGNDIDLLCLMTSCDKLEELDFVADIDAEYETPLCSYRKDGLNVIAVFEPEFYYAEVAIAHAARVINGSPFDMSSRNDRIRFHSAVRDEVLARMYKNGDLF